MMLMKIFFSRRHSPTNVTLRFVNIQNHSCLYSKSRTDLSEAFGDVFMCSCYYLELFLPQSEPTRLSQDLQAAADKYPHFRPYPPLSSGSVLQVWHLTIFRTLHSRLLLYIHVGIHSPHEQSLFSFVSIYL